jgi:ABC-2 type transport system ATP-binding protein
MLEVSQLTRCYGNFVAVEQVSFNIGQGEIVGLLGHNGAGKTTIMKMLSGYLEPNSGHIKVNGIDLTHEPKSVQRQLGYLPESLPVYAELVVADYLDYVATLKGLRGLDKSRDIKRVIEATDIGAKLLQPINTLSRGYKQRVGVAQAILGRPKLLILDEPTNGLDPTQIEHMRDLIRSIAKQATVILSTHIMQEVDALCDRVLILRDGKLIVDEELKALRSSNQLTVISSLPESVVREQVEQLSEIESFTVFSRQDSAVFQYRFTLSAQSAIDESQVNQLCTRLAKSIIQAGGELYQLRTEHRDLETLFREVNQSPRKIHPSHENTTNAA